MSSKTVSLALQLAELNQPAPAPDYDPEDVERVDTEPNGASEERGNLSAGREHYFDVAPSELRKLQESMNDPKYVGARISRQQLEEQYSDTSEDSDAVPEEDEESPEEEDVQSEAGDNASPSKDKDSSIAYAKPSQLDPAPSASVQTGNDIPSTLKRVREEERKKGKAVARQMAMYDSLLDARIRLQKCVTSMNMLPNASTIPSLMRAETQESAENALSESLSLADELLSLQETLMTDNESLTLPARKRRKPNDESDIGRDWDDELQDYSNDFASLEATFHSYLLSTLQKWSNKVLAIAPSALLPSTRTKFSRNTADRVKSAVQLIDEGLLERDKLVSRTKVWRGKEPRLLNTKADHLLAGSNDSKNNEEIHSPVDNIDIFDDTDFYQSLLRDVIDARSGNASLSLDGLTTDWRTSQKHRNMHKTVDTRASKGRKLRYEVHEKLQNFMAPIPTPGGATVTWHESQIDELFASLLGKGFTETNNSLPDNQASINVDIDEALTSGFRIFG